MERPRAEIIRHTQEDLEEAKEEDIPPPGP
jgi:hypothetical protein